ncbi:MAG: T9SS type A sorting domain-containing protein [Ferruginibacter sp.]
MNILSTQWRIAASLILGCILTSLSSATFAQQYLRTNLFANNPDGSKTLMDGNITIYGDVYCNCVDFDDAWKMTNPGINWGLLRSATTLVVERRQVVRGADTSFLKMWGMPVHAYTLQVIGKNLYLPGLLGYVKDNLTGTNIPFNLNDTTYVPFNITAAAGSNAQNRFMIIYEVLQSSTIPVFFTAIKAWRKNADMRVEWSVENEISVDSYTLQHSFTGINFSDISTVAARNSGTNSNYEQEVGKNTASYNFYRVKAKDNEGKYYYSNIAKIAGPGAGMEVNIYPNPVVNHDVQIQISVPAEGTYQVTAISSLGHVFRLPSIQAGASQSSQTIKLPPTLKPGVYRLQFYGPDNNNITKVITVL